MHAKAAYGTQSAFFRFLYGHFLLEHHNVTFPDYHLVGSQQNCPVAHDYRNVDPVFRFDFPDAAIDVRTLLIHGHADRLTLLYGLLLNTLHLRILFNKTGGDDTCRDRHSADSEECYDNGHDPSEKRNGIDVTVANRENAEKAFLNTSG